MFKKATSLLLSLMLVVTSLSVTIFSVSAADTTSTFVVAGMPAICGTEWDGSPTTSPDNVMTATGEGTYEKVFTDVAPASSLQVKVVENTADGGQNWYGQDGGENNVTFNVTSTCDVTVSFDPTTNFVTVSGDGVEMVTDLNVDAIYAVGNGDSETTWCNGIGWDPAAEANKLTEVAEGVYEITFEDVEYFDNYEVKFAANGSWADSWGGAYAGSGVETDAVYNGDNIVVDVPYDYADVTLRLDLTAFDYASKSGAKMTITVTDAAATEPTESAPVTEPVETTEPAETTEPVETAPETEPATTEAATTATEADAAPLTVTATSNFFPEVVSEYNAETKTVTVTYRLQADLKVINYQCEVYFDPNVLTLSEENNPNTTAFPKFYVNVPGYGDMAVGSVVTNYQHAGSGALYFNGSNLELYDFTDYSVFAQLTFDVNEEALGAAPVDTEIDFNMVVLSVNPGDISQADISVVDNSILNEAALSQYNVMSGASLTDPTYVPATTAETVETAPTTTEPVETDPVTEPVTTEPVETAPVTEPVTTEPVTEPATTEPVTEPSVPVTVDSYVVAGMPALCGTEWDGSATTSPDNVMTANEDGTYTKVFTDVAPANSLQLKVVANNSDGTQTWIGVDGTDFNVTFNVTTDCDVTVTYNPATNEINVTGAGVEMVTDLDIEKIIAVGNGEGTWLNGVGWDPADDTNKMEEIAEGLYTITFTDVEFFDNYEVKFAANGSWADSWGGAYAGSGVETDAVYNGDNIVVDVPYDLADVTLTLDLRNFDYASKSGAKMTITVTDTSGEEPTTTEPVTTEPVTEPATTEPVTEPATTEPVTEPATTEPVTEPVTTEPVTEPSVPVTVDSYVVAGMPALCGTEWDGSATTSPDNVMTANEDGTYTKVFTDVAPANSLQLKVVANNSDGSQTWIGVDGTDFNVTFNVTTDCDVTVTFDPATNKITVTGDGVEMVTDLDVEKIIAVGNGEGAWLNGVGWDPADDTNMMEEIAEGLYTITFADVEFFDNYEVKFAANGSWADSWGGVYAGSGVETDAVYNGDNIVVDVPYDLADVTLTLDLRNFDYASKSGAKMTITVTDTSGEEPTDPTDPTDPTEPTEPTEPAKAPLKVTATSNFFPDAVAEYNEDTQTVTVTYTMKSDIKMINNQYAINFDPDVLTLTEADNPLTTAFPKFYVDVPGVGVTAIGSVVYNFERANIGEFYFNASNLGLYDFTTDSVFAQLTFKVNEGVLGTEPVETVIDLDMEVISLSSGDISQPDIPLVDFHILDEDIAKQYNVTSTTILTESTFVPPTAPTEEPGLTITATSNLFSDSSLKWTSADGQEYVTVIYTLDTAKKLLDAQWNLTYDPASLELTDTNVMPFATSGAQYNATEGNLAGNCTSLSLYDLSAFDNTFVSATFKVLAESGETNVNLDVVDLTLAEAGDNGSVDEATEEALVIDSVVQEVASEYSATSVIIAEAAPTVPTEPTEPSTGDVTEPTEPSTGDVTEPTEPSTGDVTEPTEPSTGDVTEPSTGDVTEPSTGETDVTEPTTDEGTTPVIDVDETTAPTAAQGATSAVSGTSTSDTPSGSTSTPGGTGTVQTGNASMAIVILLVLVSACGVMYFTRKREK